MITRLAVSIVLGVFALTSHAQEWKSITSFSTIKSADGEREIIWMASTGGLLRLDAGHLTDVKYTNTEGLIANNLVAVVADPSRNRVWVAHYDGTIQILDPDASHFQNLTGLKGMTITSMSRHQDMILVAAIQGMAVINMATETVSGTATTLGGLPPQTPLLKTGADSVFFWCATSAELLKAPRGNYNVPSSWTMYSQFQGLGSHSVLDMAVVRDSVFVLTADRGLLLFNSQLDSFVNYGSGTVGDSYKISLFGNEVICYSSSILYRRSGDNWFDSGIRFVDSDGMAFFPTLLLSTIENRLVGVDENGTIRIKQLQDAWTRYDSNLPYSTFFWNMKYDSKTRVLWTASTRGWGQAGPGFSGYNTRTRRWMNFNKLTVPSIPWGYFYNVDVGADARVWLGSWGRGAVAFDPSDSTFARLDGGSGLSYLEGQCQIGTTLINEVFVDRRGHCWISTQHPCDRGRSVSVFDPSNSSFTYHNSNDVGITPGEMLEDQFGRIWLTTDPVEDEESGIGMVVYDSDRHTWDRLNVSEYPALSSNNTTAIAEDKDGNMWIGTDKGLHTFSYGELSPVYSYPDGPLSEVITDIAVDRFNNKWIGTRGGLSVLSNNGEWIHFNKETSSLVDNNIASIACDDSTGEIYVGTYDQGISILKHPIAQSNPTSLVHVFPNPFVIGDHVSLTFSSMPPQSVVKIFSLSGQLIRTLKMATATQLVLWDGKDRNGRYVSSGIYFYHVYSSSGASSRFAPKTGKIAVIRR